MFQQSFFERIFQFVQISSRSNHQTFTLLLQAVHDVKENALCPGSKKILKVIKNQQIDLVIERFEIGQAVRFNSIYILTFEVICSHI